MEIRKKKCENCIKNEKPKYSTMKEMMEALKSGVYGVKTPPKLSCYFYNL
jgi:hypothetical protein